MYGGNAERPAWYCMVLKQHRGHLPYVALGCCLVQRDGDGYDVTWFTQASEEEACEHGALGDQQSRRADADHILQEENGHDGSGKGT